MILFPAMDIKNGVCVRLYQGNFSKSEIVGENPLATAQKIASSGAEYIHIVDLDGALKGTMQNLSLIKDICEKVKIKIEVGGGIRDKAAVQNLISLGVKRVVLGTSALESFDFVKDMVKTYKDKIAVSIDARDGFVAAKGWLDISRVNYIDFAKKMESAGVKTIIFTNIKNDGTLKGPDFEGTVKLNEAVSCNIVASGGIRSIEDIKKLKENDIYGAIIGKAIYSGSIDLKEAVKSFK